MIKTLHKLTTVKLTSSTYKSLSTNATAEDDYFLKNQTATNVESTVTSKKAHISPNVSTDTTGDIINTTSDQLLRSEWSEQSEYRQPLPQITARGNYHQQNFPLQYFFVLEIRNAFIQCPRDRQNVVAYYKHDIA